MGLPLSLFWDWDLFVGFLSFLMGLLGHWLGVFIGFDLIEMGDGEKEGEI